MLVEEIQTSSIDTADDFDITLLNPTTVLEQTFANNSESLIASQQLYFLAKYSPEVLLSQKATLLKNLPRVNQPEVKKNLVVALANFPLSQTEKNYVADILFFWLKSENKNMGVKSALLRTLSMIVEQNPLQCCALSLELKAQLQNTNAGIQAEAQRLLSRMPLIG